jgi:hypothetical protein
VFLARVPNIVSTGPIHVAKGGVLIDFCVCDLSLLSLLLSLPESKSLLAEPGSVRESLLPIKKVEVNQCYNWASQCCKVQGLESDRPRLNFMNACISTSRHAWTIMTTDLNDD